MRKRMIVGAAVISLVLSCFHGAFVQGETIQVNEADEKAALEGAQTWLKTMDGGNYEKCWESAGADFKEQLTSRFSQEDASKMWIGMLQQDSATFGHVASRTLREKHYYNSEPNFPNGEYFLFVFDAILESGRLAEEHISVKKENDGQWRLNSYVIGPTEKGRNDGGKDDR